MGMDIDETRSHYQVFRFNRFLRLAFIYRANLGNFIALYSHIGSKPRITGAVDNKTIFEDKIIGLLGRNTNKKVEGKESNDEGKEEPEEILQFFTWKLSILFQLTDFCQFFPLLGVEKTKKNGDGSIFSAKAIKGGIKGGQSPF